MEELNAIDSKDRKSLSVDRATYDKLGEICAIENRNFISQLQVLINKELVRLKQSNQVEV
tara:strand:+ start:2486 stop:2665 length:180 start_codon:yes stop_codon:yes gene_type:complete